MPKPKEDMMKKLIEESVLLNKPSLKSLII